MTNDAAVAQAALMELFAIYMDALDDGEFEAWPELFVEHGVYKIVARENVERDLPIATWSCTSRAMMTDRVVAIRNASVFSPRYMRHVGSLLRVLGEEGGVISASLGFSVFETMQDEPTRVFLTGQYRAKVALTAEGPRFQELLVAYDTSLIPGLLVFPV